jgi:GntR family transcriptional regulator/MocR family aminotransferase
VHTGTFSKTLLPSLRLAYAVVPEPLLESFVAAKWVIDRYTPPLLQAALADFMEAGHFGRHLRRMRELYAERRAALLDAIAAELADVVTVVGANAGLDVAVRFASGVDDWKVQKALARVAIETEVLSRHAMEVPLSGLLLGFAPFSPARLRKAIAAARAPLTAAI